MRSRSDNNQNEIVAALRAIHVDVEIVSNKGLGFDLLCHIPKRVFIVEIKPHQIIGKRGKPLALGWTLTPKEERLKRIYGSDFNIVTTVDEALELVKGYRA